MTGQARLTAAIRHWMSDISRFSEQVLRLPLRPYQLEPARAILDSVLHGRGLTFAVMMSRQAGKNELSGQLEAYLLNLYSRRGGQIVKASPTYKPQTINSLLRLCDRLENPWNQGRWRRREGYIVQLGRARSFFFSAEPTANVVGATADLLLECDEAQDVTTDKWTKDFVPMAASTNATRVLWGTAWTSDTLLARTIQRLQQLETRDGQRRTFCYDADQVARHVPSYGPHVQEQIALLGRHHPLVKTQYFLETIDGEAGLFGRHRRALMRGDHPRLDAPEPGHRYAFLLDVAGEDENAGDAQERAMLTNPRRDATALTIVRVEPQPDSLPHYYVVDRHIWLGVKHTALHAQILTMARAWHPGWILVDSTGVGAGLSAFLAQALGETVLPVLFTPKRKSDIGWTFLAIVETGRYHDYTDDQEPDTRQFWHEVEACQYRVREGPQKSIAWGNWETPAYDGLIARGHDDLLISAALTAILDDLPWLTTGPSVAVQRADPLDDIDKGW